MPVELAIGFFDGVHAGHRRLIAAAVRAARARGARAAVYTFLEHPLEVLAGGRAAPPLLTSPRRRAELIRALGVDDVAAVHFTPRLAAMPPAAFAALLKRRFPGLDTVFCGPNWRFGAGAAGDADALRACGLNVRVVPFARRGGAPVSSTRIRAALAAGDLAEAARLLGRPCEVTGRAARGKGLGRTLGFPTVNVVPDIPGPFPRGVYAAETEFGPAVANYGVAPTLGARAWKSPLWEIHFIRPPSGGFRAPRGRVTFALRAFLRPERRFASLDALKAAIAADVARLNHPIS